MASGAKVGAEAMDGITPLHFACQKAHLETARALTSSLNVALPPDVAELMMKEAALPSPTARDASTPKELAHRLPRNGSSFVLSALGDKLEKLDDVASVERLGLATMNSGDWGAMLAGDLGSVAAMVETATAAMAEGVSNPGSFPTLAGGTSAFDSFKMAIARVAPAGGPAVK